MMLIVSLKQHHFMPTNQPTVNAFGHNNHFLQFTWLFKLALLFVFVLAACNSGNKEKSALSTAAAPPAPPKEITIWLSAFIPQNIPSLTIPITKGPYINLTAIPGPIGFDHLCYKTDNRSFSNDPLAKKRVQSLLKINLETYTLKSHVSKCDSTIELEIATFKKTCGKIGDATSVVINNFAVTGTTTKRFSFTMEGESNNPCFWQSPDIHWELPVVIEYNTQTQKAKLLGFTGTIGQFPAFEMYGKLDNATTTTTIFTEGPQAGTGPGSIPFSRTIKPTDKLLN
jgi:hypothetical protein